MKRSRFKALALLSGGLDSILAIKMVQEQDIEVEAVTFVSPFFNNEQVEETARKLGVKLHKIDISDEMLKIIQEPVFGFGKNLNPCIDCHINMIKRAGELLTRIKGDFLITGEVVGERAKSQNYNTLRLIARRSGFGPLLLRPLSARKLEPTEVEKQGMVDREKLLDISGRSRVKQLEMASRFKIDFFPQPAGGCLLTDPGFCDRLRVSMKLKKLKPRDIELLKIGRHFLTHDQVKIIVSRNEQENMRIQKIVEDEYYLFELLDRPGPFTVLCCSEPTEEEIMQAGSLTVRYSRFRQEGMVQVQYYRQNKEKNIMSAQARSHQELDLKII